MLQENGFEFDQDSVDMYMNESLSQEPTTTLAVQHANMSSESLASSMDSGSVQNMDPQDGIESSVLANELRCAGLNPHCRSSWAMTVLKILSYPELIDEYRWIRRKKN